jgi:flagellar hook-associated protein 3 FlgL
VQEAPLNAFVTTEAETQFKEATRGLGDLVIEFVPAIPATLPATGTFDVKDSGGNTLLTGLAEGANNLYGLDVNLTPPVQPIEPTPPAILPDAAYDAAMLIYNDELAATNTMTLSVSTEKINVLDVAVNLADALKNSSSMTSSELNDIIATTLEQLEQAGENNLESTAAVGTRLKSLENISSTNLDFELYTKTALSQLVDADMASVISQYKLQETTLEAAQAVFGRVSQLSLFNYIN